MCRRDELEWEEPSGSSSPIFGATVLVSTSDVMMYIGTKSHMCLICVPCVGPGAIGAFCPLPCYTLVPSARQVFPNLAEETQSTQAASVWPIGFDKWVGPRCLMGREWEITECKAHCKRIAQSIVLSSLIGYVHIDYRPTLSVHLLKTLMLKWGRLSDSIYKGLASALPVSFPGWSVRGIVRGPRAKRPRNLEW